MSNRRPTLKGRPPGSPNMPKPTVRSIRQPPACPYCGSSETNIFYTRPSQDLQGIEGKTRLRYCRINRRVRECLKCRRRFDEREYVLSGTEAETTQN